MSEAVVKKLEESLDFSPKSSKYEYVLLLSHSVSVRDALDIIHQIRDRDLSSDLYKNSEYWGMRMLAYKIKKQTLARYYFVQCELTFDSVKEIEYAFKYNNNILRYMPIKIKKFRKDKTEMFKAIKKDVEIGITSVEPEYDFFNQQKK